jgi:hypothetical protein
MTTAAAAAAAAADWIKKRLGNTYIFHMEIQE